MLLLRGPKTGITGLMVATLVAASVALAFLKRCDDQCSWPAWMRYSFALSPNSFEAKGFPRSGTKNVADTDGPVLMSSLSSVSS
jgi:hypothetical protein